MKDRLDAITTTKTPPIVITIIIRIRIRIVKMRVQIAIKSRATRDLELTMTPKLVNSRSQLILEKEEGTVWKIWLIITKIWTMRGGMIVGEAPCRREGNLKIEIDMLRGDRRWLWPQKWVRDNLRTLLSQIMTSKRHQMTELFTYSRIVKQRTIWASKISE